MSGEDTIAVMPTGRVVRYRTDRVGNNLDCHLAWCETHNEPVWVYGDGSVGCPYDHVVESIHDHSVVVAPWERPGGHPLGTGSVAPGGDR